MVREVIHRYCKQCFNFSHAPSLCGSVTDAVDSGVGSKSAEVKGECGYQSFLEE